MSDDKKLISDIKSGKGLPPIKTQSDNGSSSTGLTKENRGQNSCGLRTDQFTLNTANGTKNNK